jgi:hypothetical protein
MNEKKRRVLGRGRGRREEMDWDGMIGRKEYNSIRYNI